MKYIIAVVAAIFICLMASCSPVNKAIGVKDDHYIEEKTEDLMKSALKVEIDLSADSSECGCME